MRRTLLLVSSLAFGCGPRMVTPAPPAAAAGGELPNRKPASDLPPREDLPPEAREMLNARMLRHGEQMTVLMASVVLLDYGVTEMLASALADEPPLGRPAPGEKGTLNALLPPAFFTHQDELAIHARALAAAAKGRDDQRLVEAFAAVAKTCVGCHSVYLHESSDVPEDDEEDEATCDPGDSCDARADARADRASSL